MTTDAAAGQGPGYLFAHFTGTEEHATDEQIYFATSDDATTWSDTRPDGEPVLTSDVGERGVRDPFLVRAADGSGFFLLATDLSIYHRGGWPQARATATGSTSIVVWESPDLVRWNRPRLVDLASRIPGAGMAWAPEAIWLPGREEYLVYWATASDVDNTYGETTNMYCATTPDFRTFSEPVLWIDRERYVLDTTMIAVGDWYYRASGDGEITIERSKDPLAVSVAPVAEPYRDDHHWALVGTLSSIFDDEGYTGAALEGPELFAYNISDRPSTGTPVWGLLADRYRSGEGYLPFRTTDLSDPTADAWSEETAVDLGRLTKRHGTILPITASELAAVRCAAVGTSGDLAG